MQTGKYAKLKGSFRLVYASFAIAEMPDVEAFKQENEEEQLAVILSLLLQQSKK